MHRFGINEHSIGSRQSSIGEGKWVWEPTKFKIWSNLEFPTPRGQPNAAINLKFGMKEHTKGLVLHANFPLIGEGVPLNFKNLGCIDSLPVFAATQLSYDF